MHKPWPCQFEASAEALATCVELPHAVSKMPERAAAALVDLDAPPQADTRGVFVRGSLGLTAGLFVPHSWPRDVSQQADAIA